MSETDQQLASRIATQAGVMLVELRDELAIEGIHYWDLKDEGDIAGHRYIMDALTQARPDDVILSEEAADNRRRLSAERVWIIDPIDGTNEFAEPPRQWHYPLWASPLMLTLRRSCPRQPANAPCSSPHEPAIPTAPSRWLMPSAVMWRDLDLQAPKPWPSSWVRLTYMSMMAECTNGIQPPLQLLLLPPVYMSVEPTAHH